MVAYPGGALGTARQDQTVLAQNFDIAYAGKALAQIRAAVDGNGMDPARVLLGTVNGEILTFQGQIRLTLSVKTSESQNPPAKMASGEQIQTVRSKNDLNTDIQTYTNKVLEDTGTGSRLVETILGRSDRGFGLGGSEVPVGLPLRHFVVQETCPTCKGATKTACQPCHATGRLPCPACKGRKMAMCPACKGRKVKDTGAGQVPCPVCHRHGQVPCKRCKATGSVPCNTCHTTGKVSCSACNATGHRIHRTTVEVVAAANSDFDISALPERAAKIIEKMGGKFLAQGHATFEAGTLRPDTQKGGFVIPCSFRLPYAEIGIVFPGQSCQAIVFGEKARIVDAPNFLDRLLIDPVQKLQSAALSKSAYSALRQAARAKAIRTAILAASQYPESKAVLELRRAYPVGLSGMAARKIVALINKSLNRVTAGPALAGMGGGLLAAAGLYALAFSESIRGMIETNTSSSFASNAIDFLIFACGSFLTTLGGSLNARRAVHSILGANQEAGRGTKRLVVRRTWITLTGWALSAVLFIGLAQNLLGGNSASPIPSWLSWMEKTFGL